MANDLYGMESFPFELGTEEFILFVADTEEKRRLGLSELPAIEPDEGMLFVFPEPGPHQMWMKGTEFPLDIIFLDENMKILESVKAKPMDETLAGKHTNVSYVIELPVDSIEKYELQEGVEFKGIPEEYLKPAPKDSQGNVLKVLGPDGEYQVELKGGERIFSRKSTKRMIELAQKAEDDKGFIKLAKMVMDEVVAQNSREAEYTDEEKVNYEKDRDGKVKKVE